MVFSHLSMYFPYNILNLSVQLLSSTPSLVVIPVLLDVLNRFVETDTIVVQVLITLASYGRTGEH